MSIQASVNSVVGAAGTAAFMAAHLYQQTPAYKKNLELSKLKQEDKAIRTKVGASEEARTEVAKVVGKEAYQPSEISREFDKELLKRGAEKVDILKRRYETDPTKSNYIKYQVGKAMQERQADKLGLPAYGEEQASMANDRSLKQINSAMRIKDTMNRMRGLYDE